MLNKNRKGQTGMLTKVLGGILILYILLTVIFIFFNYASQRNFAAAAEKGIEDVATFSTKIIYPLFSFLLNLEGAGNNEAGNNEAGNNAFLVFLSFILVAIIVVGTLDSVNIFGENDQGALINLAVGIISAIIGVRFMPSDIWVSLTAPSSAFVASILVGIPFAALTFVTIKMKSQLGRRLLWGFYLLFMSYLIFFPAREASGSSAFSWIYALFLILAVAMLFLDSTVRRWFYREKHNLEYENVLGNLNVKKRLKIRQEIIEWTNVFNDVHASKADKALAAKKLSQFKRNYGQDLSVV